MCLYRAAEHCGQTQTQKKKRTYIQGVGFEEPILELERQKAVPALTRRLQQSTF